jgi:deoxyhypusine synthase
MKLSTPVEDFTWERGISAAKLLERIGSVGYQASELKKAADIIIRMKKRKAKVFLSFTSNMASSGLRGLFAQMIEAGIPDVVVTTVGTIEEDFIKARRGKFFVGSFEEDDKKLGDEGINRIGNILVPSGDYEDFEKALKKALKEIIKPGSAITPSELIRELGKYCEADENSILYQAYKSKVPIYCPAITDGSFGFQLQELRNSVDFQIDVVKDMKNIVLEASPKDEIGLIVLGGGVAKHHAILANLTNGGADYAVYITTASPYSGSLSGATTEEAKSWGKIKSSSDAVTVHGDASVLFPLAMCYVFEKV